MLPATLPALLMVAVAGYAVWRSVQKSGTGGDSDDPIGGWAVMNGYEVCERPSIGTTELLRRDDELVGIPYEVPVGPQGGAMYQLLINVGSDRQPDFVPMVVMQALLAAGFPQFSVYATGDGLPKPLVQPGMKTVDFESADFAERFHVVVDRDAPDERVGGCSTRRRWSGGSTPAAACGSSTSTAASASRGCPAAAGPSWMHSWPRRMASPTVCSRRAPRHSATDRGRTNRRGLCASRRAGGTGGQRNAAITARSRATQRSSGTRPPLG